MLLDQCEPETYLESWPDTVTPTQIEYEFRKHGYELEQFYADYPEYRNQSVPSIEVLGWMGY